MCNYFIFLYPSRINLHAPQPLSSIFPALQCTLYLSPFPAPFFPCKYHPILRYHSPPLIFNRTLPKPLSSPSPAPLPLHNPLTIPLVVPLSIFHPPYLSSHPSLHSYIALFLSNYSLSLLHPPHSSLYPLKFPFS